MTVEMIAKANVKTTPLRLGVSFSLAFQVRLRSRIMGFMRLPQKAQLSLGLNDRLRFC